ncbi:MAG TPA: 2-phospho-L-lactate guanylyltransferase [Thermomicrobiales bacterium]|nr:2-phospho-L-lactate guanylyltransferase [Thermomicrobiales bacterium]
MSERIAAVIPVRSLRGGKTRLSGVLTPAERQELIERMLGVVLAATLGAPRLGAVAVVTPDPAAAAFAKAWDGRVRTVAQDPGRPGLNEALAIGRDWALTCGADRLVTLSADLPMLTPDEVGRLAGVAAGLAVARDRRRAGTNGLSLALAGRGRQFRFAFGAGSARRHAAEARRLGLSLQCLDLPGTGFDLDEPDDLAALARGGIGASSTATRLAPSPCGIGADR